MFRNIGRKIKGYAKIIFVIYAALFTLAGIIAGISLIASGAQLMRYSRYYGGGGGLLIFLGIMAIILIPAIGLLISYISTMFMYGFGELVDSNQQMNEKMDAIITCMGGSKPEQITANTAAPAQPNWTCASCGASNQYDSKFCIKCGQQHEA